MGLTVKSFGTLGYITDDGTVPEGEELGSLGFITGTVAGVPTTGICRNTIFLINAKKKKDEWIGWV
jgi:hypothetical protein